MNNDPMQKLEAQMRETLGEEKYARMKDLQRQAESAISRGDFNEARRLDREIELLIDPNADLSKPSPASELTDFFESLLKGGPGARPTPSKCSRCGGALLQEGQVLKCTGCGLKLLP